MRITNLDRRYGINKAGVELFMGQQGFSPEAIARFAVHIRAKNSSLTEKVQGEFKAPDAVYLYTHGEAIEEVNDTLHHEMRHYWQSLQHLQEYRKHLEEYKHIKDKRAKRNFYYKYIFMGLQMPSESHLEHKDRPCEIDAKAFAAEYAPLNQFVYLQQVYHVNLPPGLVQQCEVPLRAWLKRLGSSLVLDGERAQALNLTREDAERLLAFLQRQGGRAVVLR